MEEKEKLNEENTAENTPDETIMDNDGVVMNLTEIQKQKESLLKIYNELNELPIEVLDDKLDEIKNELKEHIDILNEIAQNELQRQEELREEAIKAGQRVSVHYIEKKPEIIKEADDVRIPWSTLLLAGGVILIEATLVIIVFLLCR